MRARPASRAAKATGGPSAIAADGCNPRFTASLSGMAGSAAGGSGRSSSPLPLSLLGAEGEERQRRRLNPLASTAPRGRSSPSEPQASPSASVSMARLPRPAACHRLCHRCRGPPRGARRHELLRVRLAKAGDLAEAEGGAAVPPWPSAQAMIPRAVIDIDGADSTAMLARRRARAAPGRRSPSAGC